MHANKSEELSEIHAGDIAAATGLKFTTNRRPFSDDKHKVLLEKIEFPEPVISVAIEPKTKADQDKLTQSLQRLSVEDPSFRVLANDETGQMIISGMASSISNHRRSPEARIQSRRQRRPSASRL